MIEDSHDCVWLLRFPHEALAGGSMFAFELPGVIAAAGTPGGPPLPENYHKFAHDFLLPGDSRLMFLDIIRDPQQLQPTWDRVMALAAQTQKQQQSSKAKR